MLLKDSLREPHIAEVADCCPLRAICLMAAQHLARKQHVAVPATRRRVRASAAVRSDLCGAEGVKTKWTHLGPVDARLEVGPQLVRCDHSAAKCAAVLPLRADREVLHEVNRKNEVCAKSARHAAGRALRTVRGDLLRGHNFAAPLTLSVTRVAACFVRNQRYLWEFPATPAALEGTLGACCLVGGKDVCSDLLCWTFRDVPPSIFNLNFLLPTGKITTRTWWESLLHLDTRLASEVRPRGSTTISTRIP